LPFHPVSTQTTDPRALGYRIILFFCAMRLVYLTQCIAERAPNDYHPTARHVQVRQDSTVVHVYMIPVFPPGLYKQLLSTYVTQLLYSTMPTQTTDGDLCDVPVALRFVLAIFVLDCTSSAHICLTW
jgi:hypothetical protein